MRPISQSQPAISVFSVPNKFNIDHTLFLEDSVDNAEIPPQAHAVAVLGTFEFLAYSIGVSASAIQQD
jgi:hypothetical protein